MKSAHDPRHLRRRQTIRELFSYSFAEQEIGEQARDILANKENLDTQISASAPQWPIDKLNRIDLAILRQAVWEMHNSETPPKVIIDEAIELAKEFGSDSSSSFVNGVLGNILKNKEENTDKNENTENES